MKMSKKLVIAICAIFAIAGVAIGVVVLHKHIELQGVGETKQFDFNFENTVKVLEELLGHPVTEGDAVLGAIIDAGIRGVIYAQWVAPPPPPRRVSPNFIIESEDNLVYNLSGNFSPMNGLFSVNHIRDEGSGKSVFAIVCGEGSREFSENSDEVQRDFDLNNTLRVMRTALDIDLNSTSMSWAGRRFTERNIRGAISAEVIGTTEDGETLLKIETEDNRFYVLSLTERYGLISIAEYETGEIVEPNGE